MYPGADVGTMQQWIIFFDVGVTAQEKIIISLIANFLFSVTAINSHPIGENKYIKVYLPWN